MENGEASDRRGSVIVALVALACAAALACMLTAHFVFPHGSGNLDEVAYQAQANTLADGHLTLPAATHVPMFQPFLSGVRDGRVVFKYQPAWPALIAASDTASGTSLPARILLAIAGTLAVAWLAWELVRDRRVALLAAALMVLSPFTWVQSASLLGYQLTLVLGTGTAAALLRATRTHHARIGVLAGVLGGLALLHRPFDAVLAVVPVIGYCVYTARGELRILARDARAIALGALPFVVALAAYNRAVMGSVTRLAFGITGPVDSFGFGWHASFYVPGTGHEGQIHYTVGRAFTTIREALVTMPRFVALAPALLACAAIAFWRKRRDSRAWLLASMIAIIFVGYFFWWGTANAINFRLYRYLGPFYDYAALVPLCIAAAWGVFSLRSNRSRLALLLVGVVWAGAASVIVLGDASDAARVRSDEVARFGGDTPRLVLDTPLFPNDPYVRYANRAALDGSLVVGTDIEGRRLETIDRFPGRTVYLIRQYRRAFDAFGPMIVDRIPLQVVRARRLVVQLRSAPQPGLVATSFLAVGLLPPHFGPHGTAGIETTFTLRPSTLPADGTAVLVSAGVTTAPAAGPAPTSMTGDWQACRFEARRTGDGRVEALTPCDGWQHATYPNGQTSTTREDLNGVLDVDVSSP